MTTAHLDRTHEYSAHSGPLSFDDVVYFIEHVKQVEQDDPRTAQGLAYEFADHHLTMSPSDIVMETSAMFDLLARAREVKSLQGTLAQNIVGELGYQFGFADSEYFNALAERVVDQSPEDGIESMVMYRDVLEDASNVTTSGALHATAGLERTFDVILSDRSLPAFSHMVAQAVRESLHDVSESPERGVFRTRNDVNGGKFVSAAEQMQLRVESAHLGRKFKSMADGRTTFMARVSSDMVAVTDHSGAPLSLARLSRQAEEQITEKPIDYSVVAKLGLVSDLPVENISPKALLSNVCTAMRAFPKQTKELAPDQIGLSDITTGAFLTAYDEYLATSDAIEQLERRIHSQSEGDCLEATKRVLHDIGGDLGVMQLIRDNERSSEMYEEGLALVFAGNEYGYEMMLTAYDIATTVFRVRQLERDDATSPDWYMRFLRDEHRAIQQRAYEELEQERSLLVRSNEQYTEQLEAYLITAEQNWPEFQDTVARSCANMTEQYETLQFMPIDTIDVTNRDMLQVIHETYVRNRFSESVGFVLEELSFDAQDKAVQYMLSADWGTFSRLQKALGERVSTGDKVDLFEAFIATEFGDDFGDILLDLAECTDTGELGRAVGLIADVRKASQVIAGEFDSEDPLDKLIAERIPTAFAKRVTEMLALARQDGVDAVIESLDAVARASSELAESLKRGTFRQVDMTTNFGSFGAEEFPVTITARPDGNNARLGFTVRGMGATGKERLNIRLDYEEGRLSLDIGSGAKQGVNASDIARKVGADLARGELALSKFRGAQVALHGNHIREPFEDMPDLYSEEFAGVVNRFMYRLRLTDSTHSRTAG